MAIFYPFSDGVNEYTINLETITHIKAHDSLTTEVYFISGEHIIVSQEYQIVKGLITRASR